MWRNEVRRWLTRSFNVHVVLNDKPIPPSANLVIVNYERLHTPGIANRRWDLLICDEAHYIRNKDTDRSKAIIGVEGTKKKARRPGLADHSAKVAFLTGTPIFNRPMDLWNMIRIADPRSWSSFWSFGKRYCGAERVGIAGRVVWMFDGATNLDELQAKLRSTILVRRLKTDVMPDLPPKLRQVVVVSSKDAEDEIASELLAWRERAPDIAAKEANVVLALAAGDKDGYREALKQLNGGLSIAFTKMSAERHRIGLLKTPLVIEYVRGMLDSIQKVVVFAHHKDVVAAIEEGLRDFNPVRVDGDCSMTEKQKAVEAFQGDKSVRVIVGTIGAMGTGWTLTAASHAVFAELDWVPTTVSQAEDRLHRYGQHDNVTAVHVVLDKSLDKHITDVLLLKQAIIDRALDGDLVIETPALPNGIVQPHYPSCTDEERRLARACVTFLCDKYSNADPSSERALVAGLRSCFRFTDGQVWLALYVLDRCVASVNTSPENFLTPELLEWYRGRRSGSEDSGTPIGLVGSPERPRVHAGSESPDGQDGRSGGDERSSCVGERAVASTSGEDASSGEVLARRIPRGARRIMLRQ
jgi:hypothetical protein